MYFSYHMMIFLSYVEGIQEGTSRLVRILVSLLLNILNLLQKKEL
jgi:hypothetical protein